jgi:hypothetical protein
MQGVDADLIPILTRFNPEKRMNRQDAKDAKSKERFEIY